MLIIQYEMLLSLKKYLFSSEDMTSNFLCLGFTLEEMTAQVFVFFAAGFDTASSALTFFMYEMSQNKDIQEKVQEEIDEVMDRIGGKLSFQALQEFRYLDMCINGKVFVA